MLSNQDLVDLKHPSTHQTHYFRSKSNLDRYGFSFVLRDYASINLRLRPFCSWVHGITWWDDLLAPQDIIGPIEYRNDLNIVVANSLQNIALENTKYKNVITGGAPIIYTNDLGIRRKKNTLLAFLAHSSESQIHNIDDFQYLDYLAEEKSNFEDIYVSVFMLDKNEKIIDEILKRGLKVYLGAHPEDKLTLYRLRALLEYHEYVSSNTMGGSIAYALNFGCKVSLFHDLFKYDRSNMSLSGWSASDIARHEYVYSKEYLLKNYPDFFLPIKTSKANLKLGRSFCGASYKLSPRDVIDTVGWKLNNQLVGYVKGLKNRIFKE